jgi:glycosyltransferase involved in cell wall biosynthesis/GT2 family glycosyltransferase
VKVSVVINTDGRARQLAVCLESLRYLRYPDFEVIVVAGPTRDGTHELCEAWAGAIKYGRCPERNLSQSRNIGIAMAAGDIVAYIDDDAVPEPEWLDDIVAAFQDPGVGVAGGFLHDHTGKTYQWEFGTTDRYGNADQSWKRAAPEFNFPLSFNVPHVIGANSVFRRAALEKIGGFDEEFEYYLDETDVTTRIVDEGWMVAQLDNAFVHHKFAASHIRNQAKILTSWYSVIKNKAYFGLVTGARHTSVDKVIAEMQSTITGFRHTAHWAVENGLLTWPDVERFEEESQRGLRDGVARGLAAKRRLPPPGFIRPGQSAFKRFEAILPARDQRCYVFLSQGYPPEGTGGIARFTHQLARSVAQLGHQVHVLTAGSGHDRVDFEDGVWVHRIVVKQQEPPEREELQGTPANIWNYSRTMLGEALQIASRRKVDAVEAPIWDAEGVAFIGNPAFPLVTSLHTTLRFHLESNPKLKADERFMREFAQPMLRIERLLLESSDAIHGNSNAIVQEIEESYGFEIDRGLLRVVPHGLEDWTGAAAPQRSIARDTVEIAFIGRLELRKGIDVVLDVAPTLLREHPHVRLSFFGNDAGAGPDGRRWLERFESLPDFPALRERIAFHGEVSDERLRQAYAESDIVLAPSRFESFGLVHLEAAMFGKPVIGCRVGGMVEVVDDEVTGLLAQPGDAPSLLEALRRLVQDPGLRDRLGRAARDKYLRSFTPERMAGEVADMFARVATRERRLAAASVPPVAHEAEPLDPWSARANRVRPPREGLRIAIVGSVLKNHDAIANDIVRKSRALAQVPGWEVTVFAGYNERPDVQARIVRRASELLIEPNFLDADIVIYHFGIYYPLFDALLLGNGHAKQAVVFHNITPLEFVPPAARRVMEMSFEQLQHLHRADAIWADSRENFETLLTHGIDGDKASIQPLAVDRPQRLSMRKARGEFIEVLFIGRIVPSKGVHDLVEALALTDTGSVRFRVRVIGNLEEADPAFRKMLEDSIARLSLSGRIEFAGAVSNDERDALLAESHVLAMPSYHEGFCVPVIEAMRAGMLPVVYSAANLRYIADGLCVSAPPGDIARFAAALSQAVVDVDAVLRDPSSAKLHVDRGEMSIDDFERDVSTHLDQFEPEATAKSLRELVRKLAGN